MPTPSFFEDHSRMRVTGVALLALSTASAAATGYLAIAFTATPAAVISATVFSAAITFSVAIAAYRCLYGDYPQDPVWLQNFYTEAKNTIESASGYPQIQALYTKGRRWGLFDDAWLNKVLLQKDARNLDPADFYRKHPGAPLTDETAQIINSNMERIASEWNGDARLFYERYQTIPNLEQYDDLLKTGYTNWCLENKPLPKELCAHLLEDRLIVHLIVQFVQANLFNPTESLDPLIENTAPFLEQISEARPQQKAEARNAIIRFLATCDWQIARANSQQFLAILEAFGCSEFERNAIASYIDQCNLIKRDDIDLATLAHQANIKVDREKIEKLQATIAQLMQSRPPQHVKNRLDNDQERLEELRIKIRQIEENSYDKVQADLERFGKTLGDSKINPSILKAYNDWKNRSQLANELEDLTRRLDYYGPRNNQEELNRLEEDLLNAQNQVTGLAGALGGNPRVAKIQEEIDFLKHITLHKEKAAKMAEKLRRIPRTEEPKEAYEKEQRRAFAVQRAERCRKLIALHEQKDQIQAEADTLGESVAQRLEISRLRAENSRQKEELLASATRELATIKQVIAKELVQIYRRNLQNALQTPRPPDYPG